VKMFDEEVAQYLKEAGCRIVKFGVESGSDRIRRRVLHRYMSNRDIEQAFEAAHKFGLHTSAFVMIGLPGEEPEDVMETVKLLSKVKPGRFRWTLFFPFVGTRAYQIAEEQGTIDFEKMASLDNFTDETCMSLGAETDLLVDKAKDLFCAFVNGYADVREYREIVSQVESYDELTWKARRAEVGEELQMIDRRMRETGRRHYAVRYNRFMGVRSDWEDDHISA
jgi:anaerobic magnesium-protoporphyrin IX monomethyl ester cyclase